MYFVVSDLQNLKMAVEKYCINLVITDIYNLKMAVINSDVFCSFRFIEFENGSHVILLFKPNVFCHFDFKLSEVEK